MTKRVQLFFGMAIIAITILGDGFFRMRAAVQNEPAAADEQEACPYCLYPATTIETNEILYSDKTAS